MKTSLCAFCLACAILCAPSPAAAEAGMTGEEIVRQYKMIADYHSRYLEPSGVILPGLWSNVRKTAFTKDAIVLAALSRGYPNCRAVSKQELTEIIRRFYPEVNDVQQARHLASQKGWYVESGTRGDIASKGLRPGEYLLKTLERPYPGFAADRREASADFDALKRQYDCRCACCGSKEGEPHRYSKSVRTVLQQGHMDPSRPLSADNMIPQCEICNRADRNWWVYDKRGRVVGIGCAQVVKRCPRKLKEEIFEMLREELGK